MKDLAKEPVKTLFLGTDWESVETLKVLHEDPRFEIIGVVTQPDKKVGRKKMMTPSKVKTFAVDNDIPVYHTEAKGERYKEALDLFEPELVVCKAFGEIVPKFFLEYPKYKSINIHFSLLPKYRGAVPIQKAILDGEKITGITVMLMSEGLDEGDILEQVEEKILDHDTNQSLRERLVEKSKNVLPNILEKWIRGEMSPQKQDPSLATYCWKRDISKENAEIDWEEMSSEYIERMVRAFLPWPVVWTLLDGKRLKLFNVDVFQCDTDKEAGELFIADGVLLFSTKDKDVCIKINELQLEGKRKILSQEFINGFEDHL